MSAARPPRTLRDPWECIDYCLQKLGRHIVVGAPLGLGKPNHLLNEFYARACAEPDLQLHIFTALSLDPPLPGGGLKRRFLEPFLKRHFGDYPRLNYLVDLRRDSVPDNVTISEFYFRSGAWLGNAHMQRHYVSSNYTHVARDMQARNVNVLVQMVGIHPERPGYFSLSCNPDVTLELAERMSGRPLVRIAQVNPELPYMEGDAELPESFFDLVLDECKQPLFGVPRMPVSDADFMIGLYASTLIRDHGTLQLGIGSLGDAVAFLAGLRQTDNEQYLELFRAAEGETRIPHDTLAQWGGLGPFEKGLYAASEMFMDGFVHLYDAGILKRKVYDHEGLQEQLNAGTIEERLQDDSIEQLWRHGTLPRRLDSDTLDVLEYFGVLAEGAALDGEGFLLCADGTRIPNDFDELTHRETLARHGMGVRLRNGSLLHAAFFLGSGWMYQRLSDMDRDERRQFQMTRVARINQLYRNEALDRLQRLNSRCINTTMKATLLGSAVSDQLENGQVVSGVGGQYNFVAMAHALDQSRSVLMLRSHRAGPTGNQSNIVWEYPHETIPRHLRDIFITEYGVADLRGTSDEETIQRLLCITDSRWQEPLRRSATRAGKLDPGWQIPRAFRNNSPERVREALAPFRERGLIRDYPNGSDFTPAEQHLARALGHLKESTRTRAGKIRLMFRALGPRGQTSLGFEDEIKRMNLTEVKKLKNRLERRMLCVALRASASAR